MLIVLMPQCISRKVATAAEATALWERLVISEGRRGRTGAIMARWLGPT